MPNKELTGELVESLMKQLPEALDPGQVAALVLTLVDRYAGDNTSAAASLLLTTTVTYARTVGVHDEKIAGFLRGTAQHLEENAQPKRKVH